MKKLMRGLLLLLFSCVPGCGQMHQGYMKRGISQTILFCAVIALAVLLEMGALMMLAVPLWLYSFFDSYNLRRQLSGGGLEQMNTAEPDAYLFGVSELDARRLNELLSKRHSLIGWALVLLGLYALYQTVVGQLMRWLRDLFPWTDWLYDLLVWDAPRILGTLLIIALGLWFIRGPRKKAPEEIPAFTPGPETADPGCRPEFFREAPHAPDVPTGEIVPDAPAEETGEENGHGDD